MHDVAVLITEDLHFDVARREDILLDKHMRVAECALRFTLAGGERLLEIDMAVNPAHALAAAARDRLDQHGIADLVGLFLEEGGVLNRTMVAGHHRHSRFLDETFRSILKPHRPDGGRRRADKDHADGGTGLSELRVLREKTVSRMQAFRARLSRDIKDALRDEIALARRRWANAIGLIGEGNEGRGGIGLRMNRDHAHPETAGRTGHTQGNFAAIRDQDARKHR